MPVRNFGDIEVMIDGRVQDDGVPMQGASARRGASIRSSTGSTAPPGSSSNQSTILGVPELQLGCSHEQC